MRPALYPFAPLVILFASGGTSQAKVDFDTQIAPIFAEHCYGCHGEEKGLSRLRLQSADAITASMEAHDDLLISKKPDESELYKRLVLPADDKKRMPKGADPLSEEQTALVKQWIEEGGVFAVTAEAGEGEAEMTEEPAAAPKPERPALEPASAEAIGAAEQLGALVMPLFANAAELRVSFPSSASEVTDETVAALAPLAGQVVELDLSGTKITDAAAPSLAKFQNLDTLHLEKTGVTDSTVAAIASLPYLRYLNLHTTEVTDAAIQSLHAAPSLEKLFVWHTKVSYDAAKALEKAKPGLEVNLGWDHPGEVRERLNKELALIETRKTESAAAVTEAEKALEAAKAEQKSTTDREAEIKKQLEALDKPVEQAADGDEQVAAP